METNTIFLIVLLILSLIFLTIFILQFYIAKQLKQIKNSTEGTYKVIYDMWKSNKEG